MVRNVVTATDSVDVKFEIGHVLFVDIVGYSKLLIHEQSQQLQKLRTIARATEQFRQAEAGGKLLRLPTGDGGALVFRTSAEAPVLCAMEISRALKNDPDLRKKAHLLSVTLDPEYDKPEVLRSYGAAYAGGKFDDWDFATGDPTEVRRLAEFFGLMYKRDNGQLIHSLRTAIVTPDGKLYKIYRGNEWKPEEVLRDLKDVIMKG